MTEIHTKSGSATERLQALGLDLPAVRESSKYENHRAVDSSVYVAGQLPYKDGELLGQGIVGRDVDLETARELARQAALNALAVAADAVGGLDRVRIVQMLVFVASTPEFGQQSNVADAASELLVDVLGENGRHARTAIGVAESAAEQSGRDPDGLHGGVGPATERADSFVSRESPAPFNRPLRSSRSAACTGFNEYSTAWSTGWTPPRRSCWPT